jgi:hypothetical protein
MASIKDELRAGILKARCTRCGQVLTDLRARHYSPDPEHDDPTNPQGPCRIEYEPDDGLD